MNRDIIWRMNLESVMRILYFDPQQMSDRERKLLNAYHKKVYDTISPYLEKDEKEWLKQATREI